MSRQLPSDEIAQTVVGQPITLLYEHLAAFVPLEILAWKQQGGPEDWHFEEIRRRWKALQENTDSDFSGHEKGLQRNLSRNW